MKQALFFSIIFLMLYAHISAAQIESVQLGDQALQVELIFEDDFNDLSAWTVESTCTPYIENNMLVWPCEDEEGMGTIWCNQAIEGPTLVTYEVISLEGMQNINITGLPEGLNGLYLVTTETEGAGRKVQKLIFK